MTKLTDQFAANVDQPGSSYVLHRDDDQPGFCLKVRASGRRTWVYDAKVFGKSFRRDIGDIKLFTAKAARMIAREIGGELRQGIDRNAIVRERNREEQAAAAAKLSELMSPTIEDAAATYIDKARIKAATKSFYTELKDRELNIWANTRLKDLTDDLVIEIHDAIAKAISPNRAAKAVKFLTTLCLANNMENPVPKRLKLEKQKVRMARLEPSDGINLWAKLRSLPQSRKTAFAVFLMMTGCRSGEAIRLKVGDVDLVGWSCVFNDTKSGNDHRVYLSEACVNAIRPYVEGRQQDEPVFGECCKSGNWSRFSKTLEGIPQFSPHDLRKCFAITAVELGIPYPVIKKALNHTTSDVTLAHYAQATPSQLRDCWNRVADFYIGENNDHQEAKN